MRIRSVLASIALAFVALGQVFAGPVNVSWTIDSSQSYIRLNIPDQIINIGGGNTLPVAMRDQGATPTSPVASSWTDAGKRRAPLTGNLNTTMFKTSITFNDQLHSAPAIASGLWRPDAASWNGTTFNTANGATTPSVFAADLTVQGLLRVGFLNFYNVNTNYDGTLLGLTNYAGVANGMYNTGVLAGTTMDLDAVALISDSRSTLGALAGTVTTGGSNSVVINNLGGLNRELVMTHTVPFTVLINGLPVQASFDKKVVAYGTVPEPTSAALLGIATLLVSPRRRRCY